MMGADMHDTEGDEDEMSVEFFPDRPDLFCVEGLARALRAFLDLEQGMTEYEVIDTDIVVNIHSSVSEIRPYIVCAAVFDIEADDRFIKSLMEVQEKLHATIGRKRAKVAIGVHDLDKITPPFSYQAVRAESVRFVPLAKNEEMNLNQILLNHEKGKDYAHLLEGKELYPIIFDANREVLSFPPIINGRLTTVNEETKNLFIDVTGTDLKAVNGALNIIVTALAERGGQIGSVQMCGLETDITPDLEPTYWELPVSDSQHLLGDSLNAQDMECGLKRMGYDAELEGNVIKVLAPATRMDLLHTVDLIEDVAIGHGFERFGADLETAQTVGKLLPSTRITDRVRDIMVGLGYSEVNTLILSSEKDEFILTGIEEQTVVSIKNPITEDHTCLRRNLMPSLLRILRRNKHRDLPQRLFEAGDILQDHRRVKHLCGLSIHSKASFTEMKSVVESLLREMSASYRLIPSDYGCYVKGRAADIICQDRVIGHFGELSPSTITNFALGYPVIAFEIDFMTLLDSGKEGLF